MAKYIVLPGHYSKDSQLGKSMTSFDWKFSYGLAMCQLQIEAYQQITNEFQSLDNVLMDSLDQTIWDELVAQLGYDKDGKFYDTSKS